MPLSSFLLEALAKRAMTKRADVIVVGGGITGLITARELRLTGHSCVMVDARDRLGGRIWTRPDHFGRARDVGATFVRWSEPHVWSEVTRSRPRSRHGRRLTVALGPTGRYEGTLESLWR